MKVVAVLLAIALAAAGCSSSKPAQNVGFEKAHSLRDLDGTYRNLGEIDPKYEQSDYLSAIIWPRLDASQHRAITTIAVHAMGDTALNVVARDMNGIAKEQTFVRGKDFEFSGGKVHLKTAWSNNLKEKEQGGVFFVHTLKELGVDKKGQGKFKKNETVVGAAYLVVPIAAGHSDEVRFVRVEE